MSWKFIDDRKITGSDIRVGDHIVMSGDGTLAWEIRGADSIITTSIGTSTSTSTSVGSSVTVSSLCDSIVHSSMDTALVYHGKTIADKDYVDKATATKVDRMEMDELDYKFRRKICDLMGTIEELREEVHELREQCAHG